MGKSVMEYQDIIKIIPHRHPFIFIDRVTELKQGPNYPKRVGNRLKAIKNVTINEPFFAGHFPHRPVLPAVFVLEIMAQAGALMCYRKEDPPQDVAFAGVDKARFRKPIVPGDQLIIEMQCTKDRGQILLFEGRILVDGEVVAEAEILAKMFNLSEDATGLES